MQHNHLIHLIHILKMLYLPILKLKRFHTFLSNSSFAFFKSSSNYKTAYIASLAVVKPVPVLIRFKNSGLNLCYY